MRIHVEWDRSALAVRPVPGGDALPDLAPFAVPSKDSRKRMDALHEQLKDQYRQTEGIVFRAPVHLREAYALQFRRCVLGGTNGTTEDLLVDRHLEGIGVHQGDQG